MGYCNFTDNLHNYNLKTDERESERARVEAHEHVYPFSQGGYLVLAVYNIVQLLIPLGSVPNPETTA